MPLKTCWWMSYTHASRQDSDNSEMIPYIWVKTMLANNHLQAIRLMPYELVLMRAHQLFHLNSSSILTMIFLQLDHNLSRWNRLTHLTKPKTKGRYWADDICKSLPLSNERFCFWIDKNFNDLLLKAQLTMDYWLLLDWKDQTHVSP